MDKLRVSVEDKADGAVCPTVSDESCGLILGDSELSDDVEDRCDLIVEGLRRTLGIVPVETGQCHRDCTRVVGCQVFKDFIPSPSAQPVAGDENDGRTACGSCHATTLAGTTDKGMSLFMS
ncbi:hypothetical protein NicSoilB4_34730 [Arthrobacter sp. NicSoilB4]|nr:hypothetical protein NicSoilB4_34730 [Arthrobacter sp. NicSoilB4]